MASETRPGPAAAHAAGMHLADLLRTTYRARWNRPGLVERHSDGEVHRTAVARVLAAWLHDHPRASRPADRTVEATQLRSLVSRALDGSSLGSEALSLFVAALGIGDEDAERLWRLWRGDSGDEASTSVIGELPAPTAVPGYRPREHDTLILHEHHWVGANHSPERHRTLITIRSRVDGLAAYQYRVDTPHARVRSVRGGRVGDLTQIGPDMWAVDVQFRRALRARETTDVEFWTLLRYEHPPDPSMRRATHERIENLDLRVSFHPDALPAAVWWTQWHHYATGADTVAAREPVELDAERSVHRYVQVVERAVVGFSWQW